MFIAKLKSIKFSIWISLFVIAALVSIVFTFSFIFLNQNCTSHSFAGVKERHLWIVENGESKELFGEVEQYPWIVWSSDGQKIAYTVGFGSYSDILIYDSNTDETWNISIGSQTKETELIWSPNGQRLAYVIDPYPNTLENPNSLFIAYYDIFSRATTILTPQWEVSFHPYWVSNELLAFSQSGATFLQDIESGNIVKEGNLDLGNAIADYNQDYCLNQPDYAITLARPQS